MSTSKTPSSVLIHWEKKDERGPMGRVFESRRGKLVRMDRGVDVTNWLDRGMVQQCRVLHDTNPGNPNAGVLFVTPTDKARFEADVRKERELRDLEEVRAEWEIAWRRYLTEKAELTSVLSGYEPTPPSSYDRRWGKNRPDSPRLRVLDGRAGVFDKGLKLLLPLPELGEGEELTRRLIAAWDPSHSIGRARTRLAELGIVLPAAPLPHRVETRGSTLVVIYQATVSGVAFDVAMARFWDGREGDLDEWSDVPEARAAMSAWVEEYFARFHRREGDEVRRSGVVTTTRGTSPTFTYTSNDERSTRIGGGEEYYTVFVDGAVVGTVGQRFWQKATEFLGLVEGGWHPGLSPRMLAAFRFAHRELESGALGPLGREAALAQAGVDFNAAEVKAEGERTRAEAEAAEAQRQADEAQALRDGLEAKVCSVQADAETLRRAEYFLCFAPDLQRDIERVARGVGGLMSCRSDWQLKDWIAEAQEVMSRANAATNEAEAALHAQVQREAIAPQSPPPPVTPPAPAAPATLADLQAKFGGGNKRR